MSPPGEATLGLSGLSTLLPKAVLDNVPVLQVERLEQLVGPEQAKVTLATGALVLLLFVFAFVRRWKGRDGSGDSTERLRVFAKWAEEQISSSPEEAHRQILDDVIATFAVEAKRFEQGSSPGVRKAAAKKMGVLIDLLEAPAVNSSLRSVNWSWLRQWEKKELQQKEARLRCSVVLPTICAAERARSAGLDSSWCTRRRSSQAITSPQSLPYLAAWCTDFLQRQDTRAFMGLGTSVGDETGGFPDASPAGALYSDSSEDEDDGNNTPNRRFCLNEAEDDASAGKNDDFWDFSHRTFEGQEHCWDRPDATQAMVRGPRYLQDRKKIYSKPGMLELVEVDLVKTWTEMPHYSTSDRGRVLALREAGDDRFFFVVNFRLVPIQLVIIFAVPKDAGWRTDPEGVLFQRFLDMTTEERNARMKVLPKVTEGPWLVKQGVPDRPGIVGKKLAIEYHQTEDHIEASINCISSPAGRRLVELLKGAGRVFCMELFFIIEGQQQDELPERILGGLSVHHGHLNKLAER